MSKQGVFTYETAWHHAYGIAAATMLDGAAAATIKVAA
jgi:hypothetical protein